MANQVFIDGDTNAIQLRVQGHSTQTNPLETWEKSDGTVLAQVTEDGRYEAGDVTQITTNESLIEGYKEGTSSTTIKRSLNVFGRFTGAISNAISWLMSELKLAPGTGALSGIHAALRAKVVHENGTTNDSSAAILRAGDFEAVNQSSASSVAVGEMTSVQGRVDNQAGAKLTKARGVAAQIANGSGGNITTAAAFEVLPPENPSGTIATLIGVEVPDINQGTDNFALRTGAGKVQFGELGAGLVKSNAAGLLTNVEADTDPDVEMIGATDTEDGATGLVPQPLAGDEEKFLRGDKTWAVPPGTGGASDLDDLTDVDTTGLAAGSSLQYNGSLWKPVKHNLLATTDPTIEDGENSGYRNSSVWINQLSRAIWMCADTNAAHPTPLEEYSQANQDTVVRLRDQVPATYSADQCTGGTAIGSLTSLANGFDNNAGTSAVNNSGQTGTIGYDFGSGNNKTIRQYTITESTANAETSAPKTWTLQYSSDNTNWFTADTRTNEPSWTNGEKRTYQVNTAYSARYWRLNVSASIGGSFLALGEVEMMVAATFNNVHDKLAQTISLVSTDEVMGVIVPLRKFGNPTGTLTCRLETVDGSNNPTGTLAHANAIATYSEALLQIGLREIYFRFTGKFAVNTGTYAIVLSSDRSPDPVDYVEWGADASSPAYAGGEMKSQTASVWSNESKDAIFKVVPQAAIWVRLPSFSSDGIQHTDPTLKTWLPLNQGTHTFTTDTVNRRLTILADGNGTVQLRGLFTPIPNAPRTIKVRIPSNSQNIANNGLAIGWRESGSGKLAVLLYYFGTAANQLLVQKWNSEISFNSSYGSANGLQRDVTWFQFVDDNINLSIQVSRDEVVWHPIHSIGRTDFLTIPDQFFFGVIVQTAGSFKTTASLMSYEEF